MKKYWLIALFTLAALFAVVFSPKATRPSAFATRSTGVPPVIDTVQRQAGRLPYDSVHAPSSASSSDASRLAPLMAAPISLRDSGVPQTLELATDELYLRLPDGTQRVVSIPKSTTPEAFAAAIEQARAEHGIEPELVLYPVGAPRNEFSRRIVTRDVVISADSKSDADALAEEGGLAFKKTLAFAPDTYVYEAPTSLAALAMQIDTEAINLASVSTQLAKLSAARAMPNDPYVQLQWHLKNTGQKLILSQDNSISATPGIDANVESVWNYPESNPGNYTRGQGVVIGIVDDGMEWSHPDLAPNVLKDLQWDWNGRDNDPKPLPFHSHGTACAGVAAARGNNRTGVTGVAPEANIAGMRLIAGEKTDIDEAEAMTWKLGQIHILSNSWGPSDNGYTLGAPGKLMSDALKYAVDFGRDGKGTIITFAGGNGRSAVLDDLGNPILDQNGNPVQLGDDNSNYDGYANSIYTIAIGAVNSLGTQSNYSESGSNLVVSAPSNTTDFTGLGVMTTDNKGRWGYNPGFSGVDRNGSIDLAGTGDATRNFGGTSSACPVVSGVIALMLQKNPDLGWRDVQEILISTANSNFEDPDDPDYDADDWETNAAGFHFNHKYGAGLVDAAAAVALAENWPALGPQKSRKVTTNSTTAIGASGSGSESTTRVFSIDGDDLRVEHVTLRLTVDGIPKGNLTIALTSPDGTESIFCEPHSDTFNQLEDWTFMTVRNWGEFSAGNWTLKITNHGDTTGNLTAAELVVYGTDASLDTPPVVTAQASRTSVFIGSNLTLTATAIDKNVDGSAGTIAELEAFIDGDPLPDSANGALPLEASEAGTYTRIWVLEANKVGNYTITVNATDGDGAVATSDGIEVEVLEAPIAAWDFDTASEVSLATAVQSTRQYAANFGSGSLLFNGDSGSNEWSFKDGEIWVGPGIGMNAVGDMQGESQNNSALLLRGGKNLGAEGKSIVLAFSMRNYRTLQVSYDVSNGSSLGTPGFVEHEWQYSTDGAEWDTLQKITIGTSLNPYGYETAPLELITDVLDDKDTAYLRVKFTGASAASGLNLIDNITLLADSIITPPDKPPFEIISPSATPLGTSFTRESISGSAASSQTAASTESTIEQNLEWVAPEGGAYSMFVYAEVVDGAAFLNAPDNLLSASKDNAILGVAEPLPQTTRYDLAISSPEAQRVPLRVRLYDADRQAVLVMEEPLEFESGATVGSPSMPVRYNVAYEEVEQRIPVAQGWNSFTTSVDPEPARLSAILSDYNATEGDRLIGPTYEAVYRDGAWEPKDFELVAGATYSLLRQDEEPSEITLLGKEVKENKSPTASTDSSQPPAPQTKFAAAAPAASSHSGHSGHSHSHAAHGGSEDSKSAKKSSKKSKSLKKSKSSDKKKQSKSKRSKKSRTA